MFYSKFNPQTTYVISDTHFGHKNLVSGTTTWVDKRNCREFSTIEEHDSVVLDSLMINGAETLIHLGDFIFGDKTKLPNVVAQLRKHYSKIILLYGNHDIVIRKDYKAEFDWTGDYLEFRTGKKLWCAQHFPLLSWTDSARGSYCLGGHEHGNLNHLDFVKNSRWLDMGWDVWKRPVNLAELGEILREKPIRSLGHH